MAEIEPDEQDSMLHDSDKNNDQKKKNAACPNLIVALKLLIALGLFFGILGLMVWAILSNSEHRQAAKNCHVSSWTASQCSVTCGVGEQTLTRRVLQAQRGSGKQCPPLSKTQPCTMAACMETSQIPSAPHHVKVKPINSTLVNVSWSAPEHGEPPTGYQIYVYDFPRLPLGNKASVLKETINITQGTNRYAVVEDVKSNTVYGFRVAAYNEHGLGPKSRMKKLIIPPMSMGTNLDDVLPPDNVTMEMITNSSALISWEKITDVKGYLVKYTPEHKQEETWSAASINDPEETSYLLENRDANSTTTYVVCVAAVYKEVAPKEQVSNCSEELSISLSPSTYIVNDLHVVRVTSSSVYLQWNYEGPTDVEFYSTYKGYKEYRDQRNQMQRLEFRDVQTVTLSDEKRSFEWVNLRPFTTYTFIVGVLVNGQQQTPAQATVETMYSAAPFIEAPEPIESVDDNQFKIRVYQGPNEYGPISSYWIVMVPENYTDAKEELETTILEENLHDTSKPYITANLPAEQMRDAVESGSFVVGTDVTEDGFTNHRLLPNRAYRVLVRAFTLQKETLNSKMGDKLLYTDSMLSQTFLNAI